MKSLLILVLLLISTLAMAEPPNKIKALHYAFSESIDISITNIPCPKKEFIKEYPNMAILTNTVNFTYIAGCFKPQINDMIEIQWIGGDISAIPANAFLINQNTEF